MGFIAFCILQHQIQMTIIGFIYFYCYIFAVFTVKTVKDRIIEADVKYSLGVKGLS